MFYYISKIDKIREKCPHSKLPLKKNQHKA